MKTRLLIATLSVLLFATPVGAEDVSEACKQAGQGKDLAALLHACKPDAEKGNPEAQIALALTYRAQYNQSLFTSLDDRFQALYWFMLARDGYGRAGNSQAASGIDVMILSLDAPQAEMAEARRLANNFRPKGSGSWWKFWE